MLPLSSDASTNSIAGATDGILARMDSRGRRFVQLMLSWCVLSANRPVDCCGRYSDLCRTGRLFSKSERFEGRRETSVIAEPLAQEVGLLRTIVRNLKRTPIPIDPRAVGRSDLEKRPSVRPDHDAFNQFSECLVAHSPAISES
jgi:hypothetical protein